MELLKLIFFSAEPWVILEWNVDLRLCLRHRLGFKVGKSFVVRGFETREEVLSLLPFHRHLFQVIRKPKSIIFRFVLRVMLWQADWGGGWEGMKGVRYCCKWVLTVSNSGGELGVKVLGRVTWGGPAQGNGGWGVTTGPSHSISLCRGQTLVPRNFQCL